MPRPREPKDYEWCDNVPLNAELTKDPVPVLKAIAEGRIDTALEEFSFKKCDKQAQEFVHCAQVDGTHSTAFSSRPRPLLSCAASTRYPSSNLLNHFCAASSVHILQKGRFFSLLYSCKTENRAMLDCTKKYRSEAFRDVFRRAYAKQYPHAVLHWKTPEYETPAMEESTQ
mmetsp:Transcript_34769/g.137111  ORF Transcript_34769/g.137111 Transcript_34769/m.137111 type:complete len:171 (-) Transcript_34769:2731-3243(-)